MKNRYYKISVDVGGTSMCELKLIDITRICYGRGYSSQRKGRVV